MLLDFLSMQDVLILIGEITLLVLLGLFLFGLVVAILIVVSVRKGKFYFPRLLKPGFAVAGSLVGGLCRLLGMDDRDLTIFLIKLRNRMNREAFASIPVDRRGIFLPQCLRSTKCPSRLGAEGLSCLHCKQCDIHEGITQLEGMGYRVFIVPGSTFIKRMVKKYRFKAILGIGCLMEIREGLEMAEKMGLPAQGVVQINDGCVETCVNWDEVMETAKLGIISKPVPSSSTADEAISDAA
jgi:hypothetical protein